MLEKLINENYDIDVSLITKITGGWHSDVYLVEAGYNKYILKNIPVHGTNHPEDEGIITNFLLNNGIKVSELLLNKNNKYVCYDDGGKQYHLQKYVDGTTFELNSAPDWFMKKSAQILGKTHRELLRLKKFPIGMGDDFFKHSSPEKTKISYLQTLEHARKMQDNHIAEALENRLKQIEKLKSISLDGKRFTHSNTHGDYYIYQMICHNEDFTVIDWTSACVHPICWEVIRSFSYADVGCKNGGFDTKQFIIYVQEYLKYFPLNSYELKMMPYLFYYQLGVCNYYHSYYFEEGVNTRMALKIANLATNLMNWFYVNVDDLSEELKTIL